MRKSLLPTGRLLDESETRALVLRLSAKKGRLLPPLPMVVRRRSRLAGLRSWIWRTVTRGFAVQARRVESPVPVGR